MLETDKKQNIKSTVSRRKKRVSKEVVSDKHYYNDISKDTVRWRQTWINKEFSKRSPEYSAPAWPFSLPVAFSGLSKSAWTFCFFSCRVMHVKLCNEQTFPFQGVCMCGHACACVCTYAQNFSILLPSWRYLKYQFEVEISFWVWRSFGNFWRRSVYVITTSWHWLDIMHRSINQLLIPEKKKKGLNCFWKVISLNNYFNLRGENGCYLQNDFLPKVL